MVFLPDNIITDELGADVVFGTSNSDEIYGLGGGDVIIAGDNLDQVFGNEDGDILYASQANDTLYGGQSDDVLFGGQGNDLLFGDGGNDTLYGDKGTDLLTGGSGNDVIVIGRGTGGFSLVEINVVTDFTIPEADAEAEAEADQIALLAGLSYEDLVFDSTVTGDAIISDAVTGEILLIVEAVPPEALTPERFTPEPPPIIIPPGPISEPPLTDPPVNPEEGFEGVELIPPTIEAELANDTGSSDTDGLTSNPTITGTVTDNVSVGGLEASFGDDEFVDVSDALTADGTFTLTLTQLEAVFGGQLTDRDYTLLLRSQDINLNTSETISVSFSLDSTAPEITAELANDTGDNNTDGVTTDPTIIGTVTDAGEIVALRIGSGDNLIEANGQLDEEGNFELGQLELEAFLGESLVEDTSYTLELEAEDASGQVSTTTVNFTLEGEGQIIDPPPPGDPGMIDDDQIPDIIDTEERDVTGDPGNTIETAFDISVSSNTLMYSNTVGGDDLEDFYVFTLGAAASVSIDLNGLSNDADLFLIDSSETIIDTSEAIGITSESINRPLEAGTYYIQVKSFDGETTDYDLNVAFTSRIPGVNLGGSQEGIFELQTNESSQLINLVSSDPSLESFRSDPRFEGIDGSDFSVVIIDSGIDLDHPFFGPDNNGDGVADRIVYHQDFFDTDGDRRGSDSNGHGSNVSSIVASEDDVYTGMAPGANIIHLKVFPDEGGSASGAALEQALSWVVENVEEFNIASVNMSLGFGNFQEALTSDSLAGTDFESFSQLLEQIVAKDVIVVSASGNNFRTFQLEGEPFGVGYPSADINSLSVGAVFDSSNLPPDRLGPFNGGAQAFFAAPDIIAPWSQRNPELTDIFAPGPDSTGANFDGGIVTQGGTSQASPHIAGIAALAQQLAFETLGRRLTFEEFGDLLQETGETIIDGDDEDDNVIPTGEEYKRVDVLALGEAILELPSDPPQPPEEPEEPELVRYDFGYLYDGETLDNDFYIGYIYAEAGSFEVGRYYDDFSGNNEDGFNGLYLVFDDTGEVPSDAIADAVYVESYHDIDGSGEIYIPFYSANGFASGLDGLGSEYDFISLDSGGFDDFGLDYVEADGVEEIFIRDRFPERTDYLANSRPGRMVNADLNNDGFDELIIANNTSTDDDENSSVSILVNQGDGSFERGDDILTDSPSRGAGDDPSLDVGDVDGDNNIDLITAGPSTNEVSIHYNDGNGNLFDPVTFEAGDRPVIAETADIDSDGNIDIVLVNSEDRNDGDEPGFGYDGDTISVLFQRTDNNVLTLPAGEGVKDVVAADFDGDGDVDLATANEVENTVSVLFNRENLRFSTPFTSETFNVGERPTNIVADDFDGNGTIDLATSDFGSDTVSVLLNVGNGIFAPAELYDTNEFPSTIQSGDIDGDGDSDLIMRNSVFRDDDTQEGNSITILLNNGDATFDAPVSFQVGDVPVGLVVEDLNGDDLLDIATSNFEDQTVTVYLQA